MKASASKQTNSFFSLLAGVRDGATLVALVSNPPPATNAKTLRRRRRAENAKWIALGF